MLSRIKKWSKKKQVSDVEASPTETYRHATQNPTFVLTKQEQHHGQAETNSFEGGAQPATEENKSTSPRNPTDTLQVPSVPSNQQCSKPIPQSNSSFSLKSVVLDDKTAPEGPGRPRGLSDVSASSYHTCKGDSKSSLRHSPTTSRPGTPITTVESRMQLMEEKMFSLEKKMETIESLIRGMQLESGVQHSPSAKEKKRDDEIKRLSAVDEVI